VTIANFRLSTNTESRLMMEAYPMHTPVLLGQPIETYIWKSPVIIENADPSKTLEFTPASPIEVSQRLNTPSCYWIMIRPTIPCTWVVLCFLRTHPEWFPRPVEARGRRYRIHNGPGVHALALLYVCDCIASF
jgi:hypothetical protein